jgi:PAS domain S-box-containing protein
MLPKPLNLLFIEDSAHDAELVLLRLEKALGQISPTVVHDHSGAKRALESGTFDVILSDYLLPGSSGAQVLQIARAVAPQTPFIFISGMFGEQHAVEMMRLGAVDYVLKQNLAFLPKAVERAVAEVRERQRRRDAEEALQEIEVRARLAIDAARMGMWDYDPKADRFIWDDRCLAMYELPLGASMSMDQFYLHCHPQDRDVLRAKVHEALSVNSGNEYQAEFRLQLPSGTKRWVSTRGRAFFEDQRCVRFIGVLTDVTEQKQATEALQRLNEMLGERVERRTRERDRTWELSRDLLSVMRFDTTPVALNPAWSATLGWERDRLMSAPMWDLVHPADVDATRAEASNVAKGNVSSRFVNRLRHADGQYHWLSWTIVPDNGLMYAVARDITSERMVVEELAATNQRLREQIEERERVEATLQQMQRLEAVGQLTAGVAHDFNNLLTVILTSASFLTRDFESGNLHKSPSRLQNIREAGERGAKLTAQLLAFSRRQRLAPEPINLNDTVRGMLELLQSTLGGSVWIETRTSDDIWYALVDPTQIELIILNLAINARDAMGTGGTLRLSTFNERIDEQPVRPEDPDPGDYVVLAVQDTGSGMTDEVLAKAFEPFFTTKEVGKGSGLGLAQVFGFAKQSGGGARITTEVGVGTTVCVYLPCVKNMCGDASDPVSNDCGVVNDGQRHTILLVDDDASVREVTALMLESLGYQVVEADSGSAALKRLDSSVDLLLADFAMPGMNGAELAGVARQSYPGLPIVFVTGYAELEGLSHSNAVVVQKPYRGDELAEKLREALHGGVARENH